MEGEADEHRRFHSNTAVRLTITAQRAGYLFVINRDDEDKAQMVGWGREDLDFNNAERLVEQSYLSQGDTFEMGKGTLKITTSVREGEERWKAFLFTSKVDALKFAQAWCELTRDKGKKVRRSSFKFQKLALVERLAPQGDRNAPQGDKDNLLFTSETHYRVTSQ